MKSRIVSSFSLLLLLWTACCATDYAALKRKFDAAPNLESKQQVLGDFQDAEPALRAQDPELDTQIEQMIGSTQGFSGHVQSFDRILKDRVALQSGQSTIKNDNLNGSAKAIKSSPLYRDPGIEQSSNWLEKALERLRDLFNFRLPRRRVAAPPAPNASLLGRILIYGVIVLIAVLIGVFLYHAARHFGWQRSLRRRASALLEDDEPERTADEWLRLADGLTQQGRYREAVRCLYLACLLRFDEANVARFNRSETNWEHLARIQASPKRPTGLEFLSQTQSFDRIWYGRKVRGIEDVDQFRIWYGAIAQELAGVPA